MIVGIGASAGGLEALELFLRQVPMGCGMAFVIVQHLDPTRKGLMVEILQRFTRMKVMQVKDLKIRTDGGERYTNISIEMLPESTPLRGMVMIVFNEIPTPPVSKSSVKQGAASRGGIAPQRQNASYKKLAPSCKTPARKCKPRTRS